MPSSAREEENRGKFGIIQDGQSKKVDKRERSIVAKILHDVLVGLEK